MATEIHFQGGSIEVAETYNNVRHRVNLAMINLHNLQQGEPAVNSKGVTKNPQPAHEMSFTTIDEDGDPTGRVTINVEKYICCTSDELKDVSNSGDEDDD